MRLVARKTMMKKIYLMMGNVEIHAKPAEITTVLGSCVTVFLWDSLKRHGGANHFRAPFVPRNHPPSDKYGEVAMQTLLEGMYRLGSNKRNIKAMIFGGGNVIEQADFEINIGDANIKFAKDVLRRENIHIKSSHIGKNFGRKIKINTYNGSASISKVAPLGKTLMEIPRINKVKG